MYIGRFAPSPTGPLHFGSLLAATVSYLEARSKRGQWLLRIEDLDKPREQAGATENIIQTLLDYGFVWDGEISYQSQRLSAYQQALDSLCDHIFYCSCSRKQLISTAPSGKFGLIYPGTCRYAGLSAYGDRPHALRLRVPDQVWCFTDRLQGKYCQNLAQDIGDFIIRRSDQLFAYQLAVVVDDGWQGITHVVRGSDLLDNTPRQIYLQQCLGLATPDYLHFPVATHPDGHKLSKQTHAPAIDNQQVLQTLSQAMYFLGHRPPPLTEFASTTAFWDWAIANWDKQLIPRKLTIPFASAAHQTAH